jgi:DNA modification methylase
VFVTTLAVEWVPISKVFLSPSNPRINDPGVPHLVASIRRFGWQQPIVAKRSGEVIAGNTRLKAAQSLGIAEVPVVWFEGSELDATAYAIADNKVHDYSGWDEDALSKILVQLRTEDSLEGIGYSSDDIDELLAKLDAELPPNELADPGPQEPPVDPVTRTGDLWLLGDHRLLCGDSTSADDVARVMDGEKAVLFATDAPYAVGYTGANRPIHKGKPSGKDWTHLYREIDIPDYGVFVDDFLTAVLPHTLPSAPIYAWHAHTQQHVLAAVFEKHDILFHQVIIWCKPTPVFTHCFFQWQHEPCAFGWRRGNKPTHGIAQHSTVWHVDWEGKSRVVGNEHPTQKPLRLFELPMELHTQPGDVVIEPFSGSGTQILGAERMRRKCRALEIQPAFVDVAIRRWESASGKTATLESSGHSFADVTAERKSS